MAEATSITWTVLSYIALPFTWLASLIWAILRTILSVLATPFIYLGLWTYDALSLPIKFLARFESLFVYFGCALVLGILMGASVHYIAHVVMMALGIDKGSGAHDEPWKESEQPPREVVDKRQRLDAKTGLSTGTRLAQVPLPQASEWLQLDKSSMKSPSILMSSTILEEDDTSASDTVEYV